MQLHRPLYFDLRSNGFVSGERLRQAATDDMPSRLLLDTAARNRWLRETGLDDEAVERADTIAAVIGEYEIASLEVRMRGAEDEARLREIFIRTNTAGRRLSKSDVFDALQSSRAGVKPLAHLQFCLLYTSRCV